MPETRYTCCLRRRPDDHFTICRFQSSEVFYRSLQQAGAELAAALNGKRRVVDEKEFLFCLNARIAALKIGNWCISDTKDPSLIC